MTERANTTGSPSQRTAVGRSSVRIHCAAVNKYGRPCGAFPRAGERYCSLHRRYGATAGQQTSQRPQFRPEELEPVGIPESPRDVLRLLARTMIDVRMQRVDTRVSNAIAYLATAYLSAMQ